MHRILIRSLMIMIFCCSDGYPKVEKAQLLLYYCFRGNFGDEENV